MSKADGHNEQWKTVKLGEVGEINPSNKEPLPNQFIYIDLESVVAGELLTENHINKKEAPSRAQRIVYKDDVLYQTVRPYQKNNYIHKKEGDYVASTGYALIRCYKEYNPDFLYYKLHTYQVESVVLGLCTGTSYPAIAPNYLKKIEISIPDLSAQRRIAAILSAADKVIEQTRQLINKYKSIKQGMMEDLLKPKEGWKKVRLGEVVDVYDGTHQTPNYVDNGIPFYSVENVTANEFEHTKYITEEEHQLLTSKHRIEKGDVLMTRIGSIGVCKLVNWEVNASFYVSLALLKIKKDFDAEYLVQYSQIESFKKAVLHESLTFAYPQKINLGDINKVEMYFPYKDNKPDLTEQRRIAKILSGIDRKIEAEEKVLEKYEKMKKGLMERLLKEEKLE